MNPVIRDWQGKHVWIIGASSGIGEATAKALLERGAHVVISARKRERLEKIAAAYPHARALPLDVTDRASLATSHAEIMEHWRWIDLVLIVAGSYNEMRADSFDLDKAISLIDVNLRGVYQCLEVVLPVLLKQGAGGIGVVSSVAGLSGLPKALVYGPTKAALINLCESLFLDLRPKNIAVYMINPGFVETPMTHENNFRMPALMSAPAAAQALVKGLERGNFHIHFPRRFTNWLRFARLLPYPAYFYLVHKVTGL
ncbi:SDR family NAD(P)-dependent oxidoreductase [Undibacterium sp. TS12]|uniref:SDR family NAD(P)-dependent oxidoreductase n=1 Tax=Undibacterium sp. TS12 TaxID=2908202 RepID=UPI001F4C66FE|nr:SDR family NAD(P)-dependent oxidoreductase [Undibacterium sp. TS12]MCH8621320.1 SDR family NAD(P)-dependent oxidoreductase [Undibacterium sp. TS12]